MKTMYWIRKDGVGIIVGLIDPPQQIYDHIVYEEGHMLTQEKRMAKNVVKLEKDEKIIIGHTNVKYVELGILW